MQSEKRQVWVDGECLPQQIGAQAIDGPAKIENSSPRM